MATTTSKTVSKAFQVLELFRSRPVLSAAECARLVEMPRSSVHRLLVSLVEVGALEPAAGGGYRLALKMFEIGSQVPQQRWLYEAAYLPMENLAGRTKMSAQLAVRAGHELVYIVKLRHTQDRTRCRIGERNYLHATALGKVLLSYAPDHVADELMERGLFKFTPYTLVTREQLVRELARVRWDGYAIDREERSIGLVSVAYPVQDRSGRVVASVSLLAPAETYRQRLDQLKHQVVLARDAIELQLRPSSRSSAVGLVEPQALLGSGA